MKEPDPTRVLECFACRAPVEWEADWYPPSKAGQISFHFGYGSRHDLDGVHGYVCDDCYAKLPEWWHEAVRQETMRRHGRNRAELEAGGTHFVTDDELGSI